MKLFSLVGGLLGVAAVFAIASGSVDAQAANSQASAPTKVVIKKGDTLDKIGKANATTYVRLFDANLHIIDPDVIYAGDTLRIPGPGEKLASRAAAAKPAAKPVKKVVKAKPVRTAKVAASDNISGGVWDRLAACESGGNWHINTGNGYYGGLQFTLATWRGVGGSGYPHQNSKAEQIYRAQILLAQSGWGQWPACSAKLGLR